MQNERPDSDSPSEPKRRTIMTGAAWSIPVIAVTSASPLAAASTVPCPSLPALSTWTRQVPLSGTLGRDAAGTRAGAQGEELLVTAEARPDTGDLVVRFSTTMDVVAGTTYNFSFSFASNYGSLSAPASTGASVRLEVGPTPTTLFTGSTRPTSGATTIPNNPGEVYATYGTADPAYTATTTGAVTVAYVFVISATTPTVNGSDDIAVTRPIITCS